MTRVLETSVVDVPVPQTVLVVEDNPQSLKALGTALRRGGWRVLEADCGMRALRILRSHETVDIVLQDFMLHDYDGANLLAAIRAERPNMPVVLLSGMVQDGDDLLDGLNFDRFVKKPVDAEELRRVLADVLKSRAC